MNLRLGLAALAAMAMAAHTLGCGGPLGGCGVAPASGPNSQNGSVAFDPVTVGSSEVLEIPFQDSNPDAAETLTSATITGPDAADFEVISTFPIPIAAGSQVSIQIRYTPTHEGSASATLVLQTQEMGPSPVQLEGTGIATGG